MYFDWSWLLEMVDKIYFKEKTGRCGDGRETISGSPPASFNVLWERDNVTRVIDDTLADLNNDRNQSVI